MSAFYRPDVQTLPRDRLHALQTDRLRSLVARVYEQPVPFFERKLREAEIGPDDAIGLEDLRRISPTRKQELRDSDAAHPPLGDYRGASLAQCARVSTSTGTSGRPTVVLLTSHDLEVEHDAAGRMFWRQGYRPGEIVAHAHPGGLNGGQALLGGAIEAFGCLNVAVGPPSWKHDAESAVRLWRDLRPHHYEIFGPALHTFWETAQEMGLDPEKDLGMAADIDPPPWRTVSAGMECFAFLGSTCGDERGAHVCEDEAIVEVIDPASGNPVRDGERGHLVVTSLTKDNFLLRYDLEDLVRIDPSACPCGETSARVFWDGRARDLVRAAGKDLLPIDVWAALRDVEEVNRPALEYQIVRTPDERALSVRVEAEHPVARLEVRLGALLEERLGVPARVEVLAPGGLPRPAYKPVRVVTE